MIPDLAFWGRTLATLGIEVVLVAGLAAWISNHLTSPRHRRALWIAGFWAMALVVLGECSGARLLAGRSAPTAPDWPRTVTTRVVSAPLAKDGEPSEAIAPAARPDSAPPAPVWWPAIVWWLGSLGVATRFGTARVHLHWRQRRQARPAAPSLRKEVDSYRSPLGLGPVRVLEWPVLRGPVAFGIFRGCIALPPGFEARFAPTERTAILLHELAHLASRDPLVLLGLDLICALLWWHPVVWLARRHLEAAMEAAADEASALVPDGRTALAEALVRLGRELVPPSPSRGLGVAGASTPSQLAQRVHALLSPTPSGRRLGLLGRLMLFSTASLSALGLVIPSWPGTTESSLAHQLLLASVPPAPQETIAQPAIERRLRTPDAPTVGAAPILSTPPPNAPAPVSPVPTETTPPEPPVPSKTSPGSEEREPLAVASATAPASPSPTSSTPTQPDVVAVEVKFIGVLDREADSLDFDWLFGHSSTAADPVEVGRPTENDPAATSPHAASVRVEKSRVEGQSAVLSEAQLRALLSRLKDRGGVELIAAPRITTLSGRQAQVQINEPLTIVTGVETNTPDNSYAPNVNYVTENLTLGPSVSMMPTLENGSWRLQIESSVSEFLGYDDPGKARIEVRATNAAPLYAQIPLPRLRVRKAVAEGVVGPGQSLLIRGPTTERIQKTKGSWFRAPRFVTERHRLYLVVTPSAP